MYSKVKISGIDDILQGTLKSRFSEDIRENRLTTYPLVLNVMSCMAGDPLQGAPPTVGTAILLIATGLGGLVYISFNLIAGRGKDVSKWKIVFFFVVLLFLTANGIMQLLEVR
jgi:hypothetical protein